MPSFCFESQSSDLLDRKPALVDCDQLQLNKDTMNENEENKEKEEESKDESKVSYLTVPSTPSTRRPSTADVFIDKLKVEKLEGGGLTISGVALAGNCHITLIIFGIFFIVAGIILTYLGYSFNAQVTPPPTQEVDLDQAAVVPRGKLRKANSHLQMRIIGPIFIVLGIIMSLIGWGLFAISRKISRNEKEQRLLNSALQLCQLENTFKSSKVQQTNSSNLYTLTAPTQDQSYPVLSLRRGSFWIEPTPVEYPQIPPEGEYPSYNRRGSRSSSPLMDSGVVVWSQQNSVVEKPHLQTQNSLYQTPYHQTLLLQNQQLLPKQVQQQITTARLSSPLLNYYYGTRDYASDIATFPIESYIPVSCPLKVQSKQESDTESKERNSPPPHPHSHPPSCSNSTSSSASSHASSKKKLTDQATSNSKESGDSWDAAFNHKESADAQPKTEYLQVPFL
ncbi:hypothetical protein Avbf_01917 [Armadillidium vulgare]|nr:hypothetical protein Avbf_01917 [Armadillidium vulgare]